MSPISEDVLEYDGARWRHVEHPTRISAWSLTRDADGTIYVGASGEIGYLEADSRGVVRFVSLLSHLEKPSTRLGSVRRVLATPRGVYFLDDRHLLRWYEGRLKLWQSRP